MASGFIPGAISLDDVCDVRNLTYRIREAHYILLMLMEDNMDIAFELFGKHAEEICVAASRAFDIEPYAEFAIITADDRF